MTTEAILKVLYILTGVGMLAFTATVAIFHYRSKGDHAFPKATYALMALAFFGSLASFEGAFNSNALLIFAFSGLMISLVTLIVLMAMEMVEAVRFPSLRAMMERVEREQGQREQAQAELAERAGLLELNAAVGAAIATARTPRELAGSVAREIADALNTGLVRVWTITEDRNGYRLEGRGGSHPGRHEVGYEVDAATFCELSSRRVHSDFSQTEVEDDSRIVSQSSIISHGMQKFTAFPLKVNHSLIGMLELAHEDEIPEAQLGLFTPMAAGIAQSLQRLRDADELAASLKRFETLNKLAPAAIFVSSPEGHLKYSNSRWSELTGRQKLGDGGKLASTALMDNRWFSVLADGEREAITKRWHVAVKQQTELNFQARCLSTEDSAEIGTVGTSVSSTVRRRSEREGRSVIGVVRPLPGTSDYLGVLTDVTDLKRAERQARDQLDRVNRLTKMSTRIADKLTQSSQESGRLLTELLALLLDLFDARFGAIGIVDESVDAEENIHAPPRPLLSYSAVIDRERPDMQRLVSEHALTGDMAAIWQTGRPGLSNESVSSPFRHRRLSGFIAARLSDGPKRLGMIFVGDTNRPLSSADRDLLDRASSILGTVLSARRKVDSLNEQRLATDRTIRQQQIELEHMARVESLGELAAGLAHELNQPLAAIINYADAIRLRVERIATAACASDDTRRTAELIDRVDDQAARAAGIVKNMRVMIQKTVPERHPLDFAEVTERALQLVRPDAKLHDVAVNFTFDDRLRDHLVTANAVQIQQVVVNLVQNAIDAIREKNVPGRVEVSIVLDDDTAILRVDDNGVGLMGRTHDDLFDSFFTTKPDGLGLGLRICRTIVEAHAGGISVAESPLGGLQFEVQLPCQKRVGVATSEPNDRPKLDTAP